jgi:hypothetical protein
MTILGKILAIVNLVFSLVTAFLIVMVYSTSTNWKKSVDDWTKRYQVAVADAQTWQKAAEEAKGDRQQQFAQLQADLAAANAAVANANNQIQAKANEITQLQTAVQKAGANTTELTAEVERRRLEVKKQQELLAQRDQKLVQQEELNKQLRDKAVAEEINAKSEAERNRKLLAQIEEMSSREAEKPQSGRQASNGVTHRAPPADVEGKVLEVDAKANLITISLGSDAGIAPGQTLEIYRLEPKPEYLGTIQIVDARPHESVARPTLPLRATRIQADDKVASRIITSRK